MSESDSHSLDRRNFLARSGGLCLGCLLAQTGLSAQDSPPPKAAPNETLPGPASPTWNSEQVFNFAFRDQLIPILLALSARIGREKLIELLKAGTDEIFSVPDFVQQSFANFPRGFWEEALTSEFWIDAEGAQCKKVTRCLWAETFRKAGAEDLGYATVCYADFAVARVMGQKLERPTTLMEGHDCCQFRWTKIT